MISPQELEAIEKLCNDTVCIPKEFRAVPLLISEIRRLQSQVEVAVKGLETVVRLDQYEGIYPAGWVAAKETLEKLRNP